MSNEKMSVKVETLQLLIDQAWNNITAHEDAEAINELLRENAQLKSPVTGIPLLVPNKIQAHIIKRLKPQ